MRPLGNSVNVFGINTVCGNAPILSTVPSVLACGGLPMTEIYNSGIVGFGGGVGGLGRALVVDVTPHQGRGTVDVGLAARLSCSAWVDSESSEEGFLPASTKV